MPSQKPVKNRKGGWTLVVANPKKKLSQKERNFRISQGVNAAWKRKHSVKDTLADFRDSLSPFHAGIAFVKASGGMENAKATIALIEQVREAL